MPGLSNGALIGLSVSVVTVTAVTVAAVNGVFDPLFDRDTTVVASAPPATDQGPPADASAAGQELAADGPAEAITPRKKPKIDIVRVEPTGDAVIAGQSDAGALVAVLSNGVVVGKGVANESGDWAIVIEDPLDPGSHDIVVEARKVEGAEPVISDDMVAVHVPENESDGVFVATNRPGTPTEVLQAPPSQRTQMADRVEDDEQPAGGKARPEGEKVATAAGTAREGRHEDLAAPSDEVVPDGGEERAAGPAVDESAEGEPAEAKPDAPVDVARAELPGAPVAAEAPESESPAAPEPDAEVQAVPANPAEQPGAATKAAPPATAEYAAAGEPQREPAGIAVTEPTSEPKPAPTVTEEVRPEPEAAPTATAGVQPEVEAEPAPAVTAVARAQPAAGSESEPAPKPTVTVEAVEVERGQVYVAGQSSGDGAVRVYIEDKLIGVARPNTKGQWLVTAPETIDPGQHNVRADKVEDDKGTVSARAEVVFERDPEEVALKRIAVTTSGASDVAAGAEVDAGRREIPAMIIRKGDNLWRISRRHYGKGIRYTTIYQANQDQIRNPDLIYPGQVFLLPERDLNWANN